MSVALFGVWTPVPADGSVPVGIESAICRYTVGSDRGEYIHELWCDTGVWCWECDGDPTDNGVVPLTQDQVIVTHYMPLPSAEL